MDHKIKLEELNKETLLKLEEYMKQRELADTGGHEHVHHAKNEWQVAWNKLMETLLALERLEI